MGEDELRAEAACLRESLFRLNFKLALGEVDAVKRIRQEKSRWPESRRSLANVRWKQPLITRRSAAEEVKKNGRESGKHH